MIGNSFWCAVVAVLVGKLVGGTFMALHSVQGARLGVPQLIQSRGQFGFLGALLPVLLAVFLYAGFFMVTAVLGGQALSAAMPGTFSVDGGLVLLVVSWVPGVLVTGAVYLLVTRFAGVRGASPSRTSLQPAMQLGA